MTIKCITVTASVFYLIYGIQYAIVSLASVEGDKGFCHSFEFIFGGIVQLALTTLFVAFTFKIQQATRLHNDTILDRIRLAESESLLDRIRLEQVKMDRAILKARVDSLRNLRVTIAVMWFASFFSLVYSVCVQIFYDEQCQAAINTVLNSFFTLLDRFSSYLLWQYPVIYIFWPTKRHQAQEKRIHKITTINSQSLDTDSSTRESVYRPGDSSSSDDDNEYDFVAMGSSHRFLVKNNFDSVAESNRHSVSMRTDGGGLPRYDPARHSGQISSSSLLQNEDTFD